MYKEWINDPKNYVPVTIQLANQTGDYSGLTESDKNWLNKHTGKRKGYTTYPIAEKTLEKYLRWKELRKVKVPKELWEAHLSGDFSKVVENINIRHWISRHSRDNSDCRIYPIAIQLKKELKERKIKNKKK